jgi:flavin-dependent dehydrogenase
VAFAVGPRSATENAVVAQEIEFEMDAQQAAACKIQAHAPELYFCRDAQGYGWCFRKENFFNIGLGRLDRHKLSTHVAEFAEFLRRSDKIGFDLPTRFPGHAYLLFGYSPRKIVDDNVVLIGDSAGLAYAQSGEGIRTAVESGLLAGLVIQLARGQYSRDSIRLYSALLTQRFAPKRRLINAISAIVPRALRSAAARQLLKTRSFCTRVVVESWFLRDHEEPLRLIPAGKPEHAVRSA